MGRRVGYLGPKGTFSEEALMSAAPVGSVEPVPLATIHETVMAVEDGLVDGAIVPIENSIEGSVDVTLDTLALEAPSVRIVGELVMPIHHCLIARTLLGADQIEVVISHPQVIGQCARYIRSLPGARIETASSTAEAVQRVAREPERRWAALGNRLSAELYGCLILREEVADDPGNETRFVWLTAGGDRARAQLEVGHGARDDAGVSAWKTSLVFWGVGASSPGWLVGCLAELASRGVNMTRIESRPRGGGLGTYMFFVDVEGQLEAKAVAEAIDGLGQHCDDVRVLGSYPAASSGRRAVERR